MDALRVKSTVPPNEPAEQSSSLAGAPAGAVIPRRTAMVAAGAFGLAKVAGLAGVTGLAGVIGQTLSRTLAAEQPGDRWFPASPLARLAAGTVIVDSDQRSADGVLLLVQGRLTAGDVQAVTPTVRYYAGLFHLVYHASRGGTAGHYRLERLAVGYAAKIGDRWVVVDPDSANEQGLRLNLIGRSVLAANQKSLDQIVVVARSPTRWLFDSPVWFRQQGKTRQRLLRFFVWIAPQDGAIGTAVWLVDPSADGNRLPATQLNYLAPGHIEQADLHVDGGEFTLGIPSETAFAMTQLPKGRPYTMTDRLAAIAAAPQYSETSFTQLAVELAATLGQRRPPEE